ncbi:ATP-binding cassette domain-containing protein [Candidatus Woesearchaeota archaeon]|nr:ATP-binding cassette domain-containing protein [Candidatus Woesearchaeota archaeon]
MVAIISIKNLTKEFKTRRKEAGLKGSIKSIFSPSYKLTKAVDNVSFTIKKGEVIGFIGPNGAGKSTTIKMMSGILFPSKGKMDVFGYNPQKQRKDLSFHIGTVFGQKPQLWYHLPAIDTYNLFSKIYELDEKSYRSRLDYLVKLFEVEEIIFQPVRKLSLGQRMRCEIIASLLHGPKVLFLDEPTIGLDLIAKKKIRELLKRLNENEKVTIVLTSHDMDDVEQICNRLIIINEGKIVYDGSTKDIREKYLKYKVIKVTLERQVTSLGLNLLGVKTIENEKYTQTLEVDTSKQPVQKVISQILSKHKISDITVLDPPIEEIIERIFKKEL